MNDDTLDLSSELLFQVVGKEIDARDNQDQESNADYLPSVKALLTNKLEILSALLNINYRNQHRIGLGNLEYVNSILKNTFVSYKIYWDQLVCLLFVVLDISNQKKDYYPSFSKRFFDQIGKKNEAISKVLFKISKNEWIEDKINIRNKLVHQSFVITSYDNRRHPDARQHLGGKDDYEFNLSTHFFRIISPFHEIETYELDVANAETRSFLLENAKKLELSVSGQTPKVKLDLSNFYVLFLRYTVEIENEIARHLIDKSNDENFIEKGKKHLMPSMYKFRIPQILNHPVLPNINSCELIY